MKVHKKYNVTQVGLELTQVITIVHMLACFDVTSCVHINYARSFLYQTR